MVKLAEEDQDSTRFLWPKDPMDINSDFFIYRFKVVLFGATCSQFLLNATIKRHLQNIQDGQPVIERLQRGLYIDNLQGTGNNVQELHEQFEVAIKTFSKAHLYLREWVSNCKPLQDELRLKNVAAANQARVKVLGVYWETERDQLALQHNIQDIMVTTEGGVECDSQRLRPIRNDFTRHY